jgi:hypothetical protein
MRNGQAKDPYREAQGSILELRVAKSEVYALGVVMLVGIE